MKHYASLVLALILCSCTGPERTTPAKFKAQYAAVSQQQTMHSSEYLGQKYGRAFIRVRSMSVINKKWSDQVIYVELAELEPSFRDSLPKKEMQDGQ